MKTEQLFIENTPAVLYGEPSDTLWLFVHGQFGCKEEALPFAEIVAPDAQVLSIDLPNHGTRQNRDEEFAPWTAASELTRVMAYARAHWRATNVRATSIGAYFARLAFGRAGKSAVRVAHRGYGALDLRQDSAAGITEQILRERGMYPAREGDMLSWDYLCWVRAHPAKDWYCPQYILYGEDDSMTDLATIRTYTAQSGAELIIVPQGEHWFHTPEQLAVMADWERKHK